MNERTCIVTRKSAGPETMIRFVADPAGRVVPDLKRNLPGRGCWVTGKRDKVDLAARKNLFRRALHADVTPNGNLGQQVDQLLSRAALGALGLARKAGDVVLGATRVEAAVRVGDVSAVLHAFEASPDGLRKIDNARKAASHAGGFEIAAFKLFSESEMSLAMGGTNVIHAALLARPAGNAALKRLVALREYRIDEGDGESDFAGPENGDAS